MRELGEDEIAAHAVVLLDDCWQCNANWECWSSLAVAYILE